MELQRRLDSEKKRQREILLEKSREITSLKRNAAKCVWESFSVSINVFANF